MFQYDRGTAKARLAALERRETATFVCIVYGVQVYSCCLAPVVEAGEFAKDLNPPDAGDGKIKRGGRGKS
jgi:hypothetical protein